MSWHPGWWGLMGSDLADPVRQDGALEPPWMGPWRVRQIRPISPRIAIGSRLSSNPKATLK